MHRTVLLLSVLALFAVSPLTAKEPFRPAEPVRWAPKHEVKSLAQREIAQFEKDLKDKLGAKQLAFTPFVVKGEHSDKARLEAVTVEQMIDGYLKIMHKWADHEDAEYTPAFFGFRRVHDDGGSDLLDAPSMGLAPAFGNISGNVTFKVEWEEANGKFAKTWNENGVDEVYEVELCATLTLGIQMSVTNDQKQTYVSHTVTRPLVKDWKVSLVASEGQVQEVIKAK